MDFKKIEIEGETVCMKKSFNGWREIHPIKNEDGKINWKNLICGGSWWNLILVVVFVLVALGAIHEYRSNLSLCADLMNSTNFNLSMLNQPVDLSPFAEMNRLQPNLSIIQEAKDMLQ